MIKRSRQRSHAKQMLGIAWCLGLVFGVLASASAGHILIPIMRGVVTAPVSIIGLLIGVYLPFLLSVLAVRFCRPGIYVLAISKGFCFSFTGFSVWLAFGNAAWLISALLLFSEWMLLPVLYLFWLRHISGEKYPVWLDFLICSVIAAGVIGLDCAYISPLLIRVFD